MNGPLHSFAYDVKVETIDVTTKTRTTLEESPKSRSGHSNWYSCKTETRYSDLLSEALSLLTSFSVSEAAQIAVLVRVDDRF